ncbi:MAG: Tex family protein [Verrucomicrobiae bacterium]|nr:Tex family protein [Verrucomicrobiae bacterium]
MSENATIAKAEAAEKTAGFVEKIAAECKLTPRQVAATAQLLGEGGTVPFIARYRKEVTGSLDEVAITTIRDRLAQLAEVEARRGAILKSLEERKLLTDALKKKVGAAATLTALEDVFAPYRPKRRTRATMAKDKGLEPLADWLCANQGAGVDPLAEAAKFVVKSDDKDKAVPSPEDALAGARDILAERFTDDPEARKQVRGLFEKEAVVSSKVIDGEKDKPEAAKFRDYFAWSEALATVPSHRLLAMRRGETEGFLMVRVTVDEGRAIDLLKRLFAKGAGPGGKQVEMACEDGYKRLLSFAMETEARVSSKKAADTEAIRVFVDNVRELLLAAPLGQKKVLAIDPGFRTGCKLAVLDAQGKLLFNDVIYAAAGAETSLRQTMEKVLKLVSHFGVEAVAIGNGTAGRETEAFIQACKLPKNIPVIMVNESGASIYSASEVAREEFPDKDITVRGAVSIGRRLMDPLAELVKIDPKSIGVGQYQHDVDQGQLKHALDDVVASCVNRVGVEVNTASKQLLSYVSGLNSAIAENIVKWRNENGPFKSRSQLKKVPRFGEKTFEQAAGFLRIHGAANPLDTSAVHPESYPVVERMAGDLSCSVADLIRDANLRGKIKLQGYVSDKIGLPTLQDIFGELAKPGRDPRRQFEVFRFADGVAKPADLKPGMKLPGIVTNVTAFGAFVDVGVHQDGLVHISQLSDNFVKDPNAVVKVGQKVQVTVVELDLDRNRIALSMKTNPLIGPKAPAGQPRQAAKPAPGGRMPPPRSQGGFNRNPFADAFDRIGRS